MLSLYLILGGLSMMALSGLPACLIARNSNTGQGLTVALFLGGSAAGLFGTARTLGLATPPSLNLPWGLPWGSLAVSVDPVSAIFLMLIFTIPALASVYGLGYWKQSEHEKNGRRLGLSFGLLAGSMALVVVARDAVLFLVAWEIMALSAYFAATAEDDKYEVRRAGWIYLIATHIGTLVLIAMFALWRRATGSFALEAATGLPTRTAGLIFALSVAGFGFKAGLMPLHVWLPGAHANAPSHVSAVMSGVMLKMGIYGIVRMSGLFVECAPWWGAALLVVGALSGIIAIAFALAQRDLKRALAYSSIENVGVITMGLGLALLGRALGRPELILLGMTGALFHVWNHGLFKSLLFLGSGAIIHAVRGRDIERMGGLAKKMPATAILFVVGAMAISALPPLNGFASEWLLYLGFFKTLESSSVTGISLAAIAAVVLAMIGTLATATFVKLFGIIFLGSARSGETEHAHDPVASMTFPMGILAASCVLVGIFPMLASPALEAAVRAWAQGSAGTLAIAGIAPQAWISAVGAGLVAATAALALFGASDSRRRARAGNAQRRGPTWDCGYAQPSARMQYTGSSLAQTLVGLFSFALRPKTTPTRAIGHFPETAEFESAVPDPVLDRIVEPAFEAANRALPKIHVFQQGQTHLYILYVLIVTIALFIFGGLGAGL